MQLDKQFFRNGDRHGEYLKNLNNERGQIMKDSNSKRIFKIETISIVGDFRNVNWSLTNKNTYIPFNMKNQNNKMK